MRSTRLTAALLAAVLLPAGCASEILRASAEVSSTCGSTSALHTHTNNSGGAEIFVASIANSSSACNLRVVVRALPDGQAQEIASAGPVAWNPQQPSTATGSHVVQNNQKVEFSWECEDEFAARQACWGEVKLFQRLP